MCFPTLLDQSARLATRLCSPTQEQAQPFRSSAHSGPQHPLVPHLIMPHWLYSVPLSTHLCDIRAWGHLFRY